MAMLASGKFDALIAQGAELGSFAAGVLLVKEAGGYVYEYNQKDIRTDDVASILDSGNIIAGNTEIGPKLYALLHK